MEALPTRTILFVDENQNIINGIQRQLRPYRDQWQLFFATSGAQALQLMSQHSIDLIISDMLMQQMRGDELLIKVSEQFPKTVRMILSGYSDEEYFTRALKVAHQFLSKPCSAEVLRESISQVFKIQDCIRNPRIVSGIGDANQLPSLPKIYQELNSAIANEDTTPNKIAEIFARDMVLSAKLLQLINSPFFGLNRTISSLSEAINMIGIKKLNSLVLSIHAKTAFPVTDPKTQKYMEYIWEDAARVAELARLIALSENQLEDRPDQAYLGGLLHNLGLLIFLSRGGTQLKQLLEQVKTTDIPLPELEATIFGYTRAEAAAYVLSLWKIPPRIIEAILLQNNPYNSDYDGVNALTSLHVAAYLLQPPLTNEYDRLFSQNLDTEYLQRINKLERLSDWKYLANKVIAHHANKQR